MRLRRQPPVAKSARPLQQRMKMTTTPQRVMIVLLVLATQAAGFAMPGPEATAAGALKFPFAAGAEWYVSQGYHTSPAEGWSHYNCDPQSGKDEISQTEACEAGWQYKYSFDFRRVDGTETGQPVLSPANGVIRWIDPSHGGLSIDLGDGFAVALFHADLVGDLAEGQPVTQGQPLGLVSPPGGGENGGTPHIHLTLWATEDGGNWSRQAVPFTGPHALDGYDFPARNDRQQNQHWNTVVVSTNQQVGEMPDLAGTPVATPEATPLATPVTDAGATLTVAAARAIVGTQLTINGAGFEPDEWVDLYWDTPDTVPLSETTANEAGAWTLSPPIPDATGGEHRLIAIAESSGRQAEGTVEIIPALSRDPVAGPVGTAITVTVTGFGAQEQVDLRWGGDQGQPIASVTTDEFGSGLLEIAIPDGGEGSVDLVALGQASGSRAVGTIRVNGSASPDIVAGGSMLSPGTFQVTATVLGLAGGSTSSGHVIQPDDRLVSLPACTTSSCPWLEPGMVDPLFGSRIECGELCYVRVTNPLNQQCAVGPVLETGPWFTLDDWWNPAESRMVNNLPTIVQRLDQGYPAAAAAMDGLDVGFGRTPNGIGLSNKGYEVGNPAAIDLSTGIWHDIGFDPNTGIGDVVVTLLWLTGEDPAAAAAACGVPAEATPEAATPEAATPEASPPAAANPSEAIETTTPQPEATEEAEARPRRRQRTEEPAPEPAAEFPAEPAADVADPVAEAPAAEPEAEIPTEPAADAATDPETESAGPAEAKEKKRDRDGGDDAARRKADRIRDRFGQ